MYIKDNIVDGWYIDNNGVEIELPIEIPPSVLQLGSVEVESFVERTLLEHHCGDDTSFGFTKTW